MVVRWSWLLLFQSNILQIQTPVEEVLPSVHEVLGVGKLEQRLQDALRERDEERGMATLVLHIK